jgi:Mrp family chromosome partitioning ATPase
MSVLDQAFVRAYQRLDGTRSPAILRPVQPVAKAEVLPAAVSRKSSQEDGRSNAALCDALAKVFEQEPQNRRKKASPENHDWIGTLLESPTLKAGRHAAESQRLAPTRKPSPVDAASAASAAPAVEPSSPCRAASVPSIAAAETERPIQSPAEQSHESGAACSAICERPPVAGSDAGSEAMAATGVAAGDATRLARPDGDAPHATAPPSHQPELPSAATRCEARLLVDSLLWPDSVFRMLSAGAGALDRVVEHIMSAGLRGRNVVALTGCRQGDGCTSLVLALARRLADRSVRAALVDADFDRPRLARRLGLAPQFGWTDVLQGRAPLAESLIRSAKDGLVVLPGRATSPADTTETYADPIATIIQLKTQYDLVLVDLGNGGGRAPEAIARIELLHDWADAVLLVHNVRRTPAAEVAAKWGLLRGAGIAEVAIVENCV